MDAEILSAVQGGATLITANRRLARSLLDDYDAAHAAAGNRVWASPDVLPLGAWLRRCYDERADRFGEARLLLGDHSRLLYPFRFERFATGDLHPVSSSPYPWS